MAIATTGLDQLVIDLRADTRVTQIRDTRTSSAFKPDMSVSDELKKCLSFIKGKSKKVRGPEDLANVQLTLDEIQEYRDRAIEIYLDAIDKKARVDEGWSLSYAVIILKPEVASKTANVQKAIDTLVNEEFSDLSTGWDIITKQAEAVIRNCRDAYYAVNTQSETAKQMWFQAQRIDRDDGSEKREALASQMNKTTRA